MNYLGYDKCDRCGDYQPLIQFNIIQKFTIQLCLNCLIKAKNELIENIEKEGK